MYECMYNYNTKGRITARIDHFTRDVCIRPSQRRILIVKTRVRFSCRIILMYLICNGSLMYKLWEKKGTIVSKKYSKYKNPSSCIISHKKTTFNIATPVDVQRANYH